MLIVMRKTSLLCLLLSLFSVCFSQSKSRQLFTENWKFMLDSTNAYQDPAFNDTAWRSLNLPHDWSIELPFDSTSPTGNGGGALRGGVGWYRKTFLLPLADKNKNISIDFDGVYCNSEVWINGHYLGKRPNGYISFRYDLTSFLNFGDEKNVIVVKADNLRQPNSRWYSGSGIYRNVWLVKTSPVHVGQWGTFVTTPQVMKDKEVGLGDEVFITGHFTHHHGNRRNVPIVRIENLACIIMIPTVLLAAPDETCRRYRRTWCSGIGKVEGLHDSARFMVVGQSVIC